MQAVPTLAVPRATPSIRALLELTKPGVSRLVLVTMICGAAAAGGPRDWLRLLAAIVGTTLVVGAANALNMYVERDLDGMMERTRGRPLPQGRLAPDTALGFGLGLGVSGLVLLPFLASPLVAALAGTALVVYVLAYTPLKRRTPLALYVGAVPGAIPPLIGWAAAHGDLSAPAFAPFLLLLVWQLPHFLAIALFRREEYARAGLRVLPVVRGVPATARAIVACSALLAVATALPPWLGLGGVAYLSVALPLGIGFLAHSLTGLATAAPERWARRVFFLSLPYLVLALGALVALPG